jgi:hypothetical protein
MSLISKSARVLANHTYPEMLPKAGVKRSPRRVPGYSSKRIRLVGSRNDVKKT